MKRNLPSMIAGVVLVVILGLYMLTYQVRSTEVAVVKTFGKATPESVVSASGLGFRWPWPVQAIEHFDNRVQTTELTGEETLTADKKSVIVSTSVGWRIEDPYKFLVNCTDQKTAEENLRDRVRNDQKTILGNYAFSNLVSSNPDELRFGEIEQKLLADIRPQLSKDFGIQVESVRIDRLALPAAVTEKVFEAMKKERQAQADKYTSEGQAEAERIKKEAESIANTIMSFADRKAAEIEAEGQAAAVATNKTFSKDEPLAVFLLKLQELESLLKERATIIMDAQQAPFGELRSTPPAVGGSTSARPTTRPADSAIQIATSALPEIVAPR